MSLSLRGATLCCVDMRHPVTAAVLLWPQYGLCGSCSAASSSISATYLQNVFGSTVFGAVFTVILGGMEHEFREDHDNL
jgi:hypothetical protein